MYKQSRSIALKEGIPFLVVSLVIAVVFLLASSYSDKGATLGNIAQNLSYHYGTKTLVGATPDQIGQYAIEYAQHHLDTTGKMQVMLSRPVTDEEWPALGLGCPPSKTTIEVPPQTLVILKGDFDVNRAMSGVGGGFPWHFKYIAYIFDQWSAQHISFIFSLNGGRFKLALNDPTLPSDNPDGDKLAGRSICPTPLPYPRVLHYGEVAPPLDAPPTYIPPTEEVPTPSVPIPSPVSTELAK